MNITDNGRAKCAAVLFFHGGESGRFRSDQIVQSISFMVNCFQGEDLVKGTFVLFIIKILLEGFTVARGQAR